MEHQKRSEIGEDLPLTVYPEGTTTTGPLIKFQRGAFKSETSVQPFVVKYKSPLISPKTGIFDLTLMYLMITPLVLFCKVEVIELPTFRPNQFFWDKYAKPGKDRAEVYSQVIREIMHDLGGLEYPSRDTNVYDKYNLEDTYYEILRNAEEFNGKNKISEN